MKTIYFIYNILACLFIGLLFSCTNDEFEKEQAVDQSGPKVVVNATMIGYEGEDGQATKLTDGGTWQLGDVIYMCVGAEENSFKLTYQLGGNWELEEWLGGDMNKAFAASSGKLTALYCSNARNWKREDGKVTGLTWGDIVYTKTGEYKRANDVIYFNINLDTRPIAKLVIKDVTELFVPGNKMKGFMYLSGLFDLRWDNEGSTRTTYSYDSSTGTLTVWGVFDADDLEVTLALTDYPFIATPIPIKYKRTYTGKKLQAGQTVTIKGPLGDEAGKWQKYDQHGDLIKTATIHYGKTIVYVRPGSGIRVPVISMQGELPDNYSMVAGDSIFIRVLDQDGKALNLANSGIFLNFDQTDIFIRTTIDDTTAVLFANASGTPTLMAKTPSGYSPREIIRTFNLTRNQNKPILYYRKSDTWEEIPYRNYRNYRLREYDIFKVVYKGQDVIISQGKQSSGPTVGVIVDNSEVIGIENIIENNQIKTFKLKYLDFGTAKVTVKMLKETDVPEDEFKFFIVPTKP